jgi:hypothetical protein
MNRVAMVAAVGFLALAAGCAEQQKEPTEETKRKPQPVPTITLGGGLSHTQYIKGKEGKESLVVAVGNGATFAALYVYDRDGNCVALDEGRAPIKDDLAVSWVPAKDEPYAVELVNFGRAENKFSMATR